MTREYREYAKSRIEYLLKICRLDERDKEALEVAIKALSQEPCTDAVSREAVLDETIRKNSIWNSITNSEGKNLEEIIFELPSVNPQETVTEFADRCRECGARYGKLLKQKSGKWIDDGFYAEGHSHKAFHCSKCGHNVLGFKEDLSNYCPNCGAKMESEDKG